nr:PREDICTED: uncharacterized protein LOC109633171 [Paralichthys olivaceus]
MERTIKTRVLQALEDLSRKNLEKFCFHLRNRGDKPKIRTREVEKKSPVEITDLMVSKFTAVRAVKVTVETLRRIDCNQEAETLESKTKACVDTGDPIFCKTSDGKLNTKPSQEAENHAARPFPLNAVQGAPVKRKRSLQPGQEGMALVGFGAHRWETLQGLYEDKYKISYVKYLRTMESECTPGSKMEDAIRYILQRDQELAAAGTAPSRPFTRSFCRGPRKRKSNRTSSSRSVQGKQKRTGSKTQQTCLLRF